MANNDFAFKGLGLGLVLLSLVGCASVPKQSESAPAAVPVAAVREYSDARAAADRAYAAGEYRLAVPLYLEYLRKRSNDSEAWFRLGNSYASSGRLYEAARSYRVVLELDPQHARARHNLGLVSVELGVAALLEARRQLPAVDEQAAGTMRYLACVMETLRGRPDPRACRPES